MTSFKPCYFEPSVLQTPKATAVKKVKWIIGWKKMHFFPSIDRFRYIKIQPKTIDISARLWRMNPTNSVVISQSLVLTFIVLSWILIDRNWSIFSWTEWPYLHTGGLPSAISKWCCLKSNFDLLLETIFFRIAGTLAAENSVSGKTQSLFVTFFNEYNI